jgi:hypothetical protein
MKSTKSRPQPVITAIPEPPEEDRNESALTQSDINKLMEYSFFLEAVVDLMQTASQRRPDDREGVIDCATVASLLRPVSGQFHDFIFNDLEERDTWKESERMEGLSLVYRKKNGGAA